MASILFLSRSFDKAALTLALEAGVDGIILPACHVAGASALSRLPVYALEDFAVFALKNKNDEQYAAATLAAGKPVLLESGWEVIPVENLLAAAPVAPQAMPCGLCLEAGSLDDAKLGAGILERGAPMLAVNADGLGQIKEIVAQVRYSPPPVQLEEAEIIEICPAGLGHRVCVDTLSLLQSGQGMLTGNSSAFTFLVQAETEHNTYVASRPFRINAGAVHSYAILPGDRTSYLEELKPGSEVLVVNKDGNCTIATAGRIKTERRPMLLVRARSKNGQEGAVFLQNAETIRLITPEGHKSVVELKPGHKVMCHLDTAGRHFGMRVTENIQES